MGQVTIYLDDELESRVKSSAKARGMPVSRWIAELISQQAGDDWPAEVRQLAGAWKDFPSAESLRDSGAADIEREEL